MQNAWLDKTQVGSRFEGEISVISDIHITPPYGRKQREIEEPHDKDEREE